MAAIGSNPSLFTGASGVGSTSANQSGDSANKGAQDDSGTFMQLVEGMIQGGTPGDQLPSNLAAFLLTGDSSSLEGITVDTQDADGDDTDDEALAALAALLSGLQTFHAMPVANSATPSDDVSTAGVGATAGESTLQTLLDTSQAALATAMDGAAVAADNATKSAVSTDAAATPPPTNSAAHAQSLLQAHKAAEAAPQAASAEVRTPVGAPGWSDEIGTHLTMMAANGREAASLRLSPEHLGPLEIRIAMKDGEASVMFNASNPDTRSALEQSLPRLREMFASQGLVLGDAGVSRDAPRDSFKPATFASASRGSGDAGAVSDVTPITMSRRGLVDTYV
jgi:flagellar hook-length control protein FliK